MRYLIGLALVSLTSCNIVKNIFSKSEENHAHSAKTEYQLSLEKDAAQLSRWQHTDRGTVLFLDSNAKINIDEKGNISAQAEKISISTQDSQTTKTEQSNDSERQSAYFQDSRDSTSKTEKTKTKHKKTNFKTSFAIFLTVLVFAAATAALRRLKIF